MPLITPGVKPRAFARCLAGILRAVAVPRVARPTGRRALVADVAPRGFLGGAVSSGDGRWIVDTDVHDPYTLGTFVWFSR